MKTGIIFHWKKLHGLCFAWWIRILDETIWMAQMIKVKNNRKEQYKTSIITIYVNSLNEMYNDVLMIMTIRFMIPRLASLFTSTVIPILTAWSRATKDPFLQCCHTGMPRRGHERWHATSHIIQTQSQPVARISVTADCQTGRRDYLNYQVWANRGIPAIYHQHHRLASCTNVSILFGHKIRWEWLVRGMGGKVNHLND